MNDFIIDQMIEDFQSGDTTISELWNLLEDMGESISDEKTHEIRVTISEFLIDNELIEECDIDDVDLESFFDNQNDCEYKNSIIETAFRNEYE